MNFQHIRILIARPWVEASNLNKHTWAPSRIFIARPWVESSSLNKSTWAPSRLQLFTKHE